MNNLGDGDYKSMIVWHYHSKSDMCFTHHVRLEKYSHIFVIPPKKSDLFQHLRIQNIQRRSTQEHSLVKIVSLKK